MPNHPRPTRPKRRILRTPKPPPETIATPVVGPSSDSSDAPTTGNTAIALEDFNVPAAYERLGGTIGQAFKPFLKTHRFVTGYHKMWKTTVFIQQRKTAFLDFESGSSNLPLGPGSVRFSIQTYAQLESLIKQLRADAMRQRCPFEHVVFDTVDRMVPLIADHLTQTVCKGTDVYAYGGGKRGYQLVGLGTVLFPRQIATLGLGWTCIGHIKMRMTRTLEGGEEYEKPAASVQPMIASALAEDADFIWRIKSTVKATGIAVGPKVKKAKHLKPTYVRQYWLETTTPDDECGTLTTDERGSRIQLPPLLELKRRGSIEEIEQLYKTACDREEAEWAT